MAIQLTRLAASITVNGRKIRNKVVVPPMADFAMTGDDGFVNDRHIRHYQSFAEGGAGLIIVEACAVSEIKETRNTITLRDDACIVGLARLAGAIISHGAVSLVQLLHPGLPFLPGKSLSEIRREQLLKHKAEFVAAALRCKKAGFHGVELHAAHGYYLNQIIEKNDRTDEYGGSFENRIRFLEALIVEIKDVCGQDFIVAVRFGNANEEELLQTARAIENAGGDLLDVSTGCSPYRDSPRSFLFDRKIYIASLVKKVVSIPVIGVGNIISGAQAEQILDLDLADMIAVGRGHLCDPQWTNKVISGTTPNRCLKCKTCLWYVDGRKCPALRKDSMYS